MRVVRINTTAWLEEDFYLVTTLDNQDIVEVVQPLVNAERDGEGEYDNETIFKALKSRYPTRYVEMYTEADELIF
jgi:hypothetical protein